MYVFGIIYIILKKYIERKIYKYRFMFIKRMIDFNDYDLCFIYNKDIKIFLKNLNLYMFF